MFELDAMTLDSVLEAYYSAIMWGFSELRRSTKAHTQYGL
jgi:hypothetical protein